MVPVLQGINMRVTGLATLVDKVLKAAAKAVDDSERYTALSSVRINNSETLEQRLMSFQKEGVKFGLRCGGRVSKAAASRAGSDGAASTGCCSSSSNSRQRTSFHNLCCLMTGDWTCQWYAVVITAYQYSTLTDSQQSLGVPAPAVWPCFHS
jgi:hypothetical protein